MEYWIVFKIKKDKFYYVSGTDEYGNPMHTTDEKMALHFRIFSEAMEYFPLGYVVSKQYA